MLGVLAPSRFRNISCPLISTPRAQKRSHQRFSRIPFSSGSSSLGFGISSFVLAAWGFSAFPFHAPWGSSDSPPLITAVPPLGAAPTRKSALSSFSSLHLYFFFLRVVARPRCRRGPLTPTTLSSPLLYAFHLFPPPPKTYAEEGGEDYFLLLVLSWVTTPLTNDSL